MSARSLTPNWVETFHDLQSASTVEGLWGVLVAWHGIREFIRVGRAVPAVHAIPPSRLDERRRDGSVAVHRLPMAQRDPPPHRSPRRRPASSTTNDSTRSPTGSAARRARSPSRPRMPSAQIGAATVRRPIWPPLRRWAARHQVERHPERWRAVIDASATLPSRDAAATVAGVMDAADHVPPDQRATLAEIGLDHGSGTVRLAALPILASTSGADAAIAAAQRDPSAKVRAWKPAPSAAAQNPVVTDPPSGAAEPSISQASLFDR